MINSGDRLLRDTLSIIVITTLLFFAFVCLSPGRIDATDSRDTLLVGALLPLTGSIKTHGQSCADALSAALKIIRSQHIEGAAGLDILFMDTAGDPERALTNLKEMYKRGIRIVIGPMSSEEAVHIVDYANSNNMILISPSATASVISKPDNLLRLAPADNHQAEGLLLLMRKQNISTLAVLHIDDVYGKGLYDELAKQAKAHEITVLPAIPLAISGTYLQNAIVNLEAQLVNKQRSSTAVLLIDDDERAISLIKDINNNSMLRDFKWYVSESITGSELLVGDKKAAEFAAATAMEGFSLSTEGKDEFVLGSGPPLLNYIISENSKAYISPYAYMAWDALWLVAYAHQKIKSYDAALFKEELSRESRYYINAYSTTYRLDMNGDSASARYARYRVGKEGDRNYRWKLSGNYLKTRNFMSVVNEFTKTYYAKSGTAMIGALLPVTGQLSEDGMEAQHILRIAQESANLYFASRAPGLSFSVEIYDTGTNPQKALNALKELHKRGVKVCLGPYSSAELAAVESFALENGIILISPASSVLSLAKPDRIVRLMVNDGIQAKALASLLESKKAENLLIISREDIYGRGLASAIKSVFKGNVDFISYDVNKLDAKSLIEKAVPMIGKKGKSAVLVISFEEVAEIIKAIPGNSPLLDIQWFGCEGTGNVNRLIADREFTDKATRIRFIGASFSHSGRYKTSLPYALSASINAGFRPLSGYGINIYDAFSLLTEALSGLGPSASGADLWNLLKRINYFGGIGGPFELDGNSDRTTGFFRFYSIFGKENKYQWNLIADYENTFSVRGVLTTY